jgi:hypothetical protein
MIKTSKNNIVANVYTYTAMDFTPVYRIRVLKNIKAGSELRFDTATNVITTEIKVAPPNQNK